MSSISSLGPEGAAGDVEMRDLESARMGSVAVHPRRWGVGRIVRLVLPPAGVGLAGLVIWEAVVRLQQIPIYILPGPWLILQTLVKDWGTLYPSLLVTLAIAGAALLVATVAGVMIAILFTQSRWIELSLFPYAVILQVTPIVAIAPLIIIWVKNIPIALLICAWIVAFFPIVSNTTLGLNSVDHTLQHLFQLYRASRRQIIWHLRLPSAMPYFLGGLRISGGLALIGAIVAEIAAGSAGQGSGLAYRIVESGFRLNIPRMFAALLLISVAGVTIHLLLTALSHWLLRDWHDSERGRES